MKVMLIVLALIGWVFAVNNDKRTDAVDSMAIIDVSTSDTTISIRNYGRIRCIFADVGGLVKMWMRTRGGDTITVVRYLNDAVPYPYSNIIKVFPLWNGTDSCECQIYDSLGVAHRGIGLGF